MPWAKNIHPAHLFVTRSGFFIPLMAAAGFLVLMFLYSPYRTIFQFDSDEGVNLIKARLVEDGYPLFNQVWSDQPPVFTLILAHTLKLTQNSLLAGRTLVLCFAALLVWCLVYFVQKTWGTWHALTTALLLLILPYFPELSVSVMVGLPAISLAFVSLAAVTAWHEQHKPYWLIVSGAALGLSVMTKLFTGILAPILIMGIFLDGIGHAQAGGSIGDKQWPQNGSDLLRAARKHWRKALGQALLWLGVFGLSVGSIILLVVKPDHVLDLILPHLSAVKAEYFDAYQQEYPIWRLFQGTPVFFLLAGMGAARAVQTRRWLALYPLMWAVIAFILLNFHSPVWYHHTLLVTLPACALSSGAAGELVALPLSSLRQHKWSIVSLARWVVLVLVLGALLWLRLPPALSEFDDHPYFIELRNAQAPRENKILDEIKPYEPYTHWMFTDTPMFAFQADLPVIPELAVITSKRLTSGELTAQGMIGLLQQYKPEIILLGRYTLPELEGILTSLYRLDDSRLGIKLYIRADLPDL